ncbi:DNA topoisomerase IB [Sphingomonas naphthae]|uniref:DNA topoisomerase n=1 Tax=Sphingomonas naphthae TaxID=1813468 RepID=A0ABY7TFT1_9SPHN|nr:DNA topoisomerase IB [Sphingomonas naphthae]WCT72091.1 DNA topoisomerase IB [Sphingomonas naphthae]
MTAKSAANDPHPLPSKLVYVDDQLPGISRRKSGHGWAYFDARGQRIRDREEIDRLNAVAMPPAYKDCWFCPSPHGHILATGFDEKGRKQYRYHPAFREAKDSAKYERCADFGRHLPLLRARVEADLAGRKLARDTVLAAIVRLLDLGRVRVGNEAYAKANKSFGATTLRNRHAKVSGSKLRLEYLGKSGKMQKLTIEDGRLARIVRRCQDLPGQHLFQYLDDDGARHGVGSADVNAYIREATGEDFSAKDFRTWGASVLAFDHIWAAGAEGKVSLKGMLEEVAAALGNTPAISRKSYVHPALIEMCKTGDVTSLCEARLPRATRYLNPHERALIAFLDELASATSKETAKAA